MSPDLNTVENIWKMISDLVYDEIQPKNIKELRLKINKAVDIINNEKIFLFYICMTHFDVD